VGVHRAWGPSPGTVLSIDTWALDALARLSERTDVHRVGVGLVEGGGRRLRFTLSDRDQAAPRVAWCDVDAYDDVPINLALRRRTAVVGTLDELAARFADYVGRQRSTSTVALAAVPVEVAGRPIGGFVLFYDRRRTFDAAERQELTSLGQELGASLHLIQRGEARRAVLAAADDSGTGALAADHEVAPEAAAVSEARRFLRGTLHDWDVDDDTADTAVLCLSELVTNAVIHSHAGCSVRVQLDAGVLVVTVRDSGRADAQTVEQLEDSLQVHGRGLQVVEALASRWGYELDVEGTTVWFELTV
jgi:anti-sigma regulatory factor (Ser/Thr protein kinase)